MTNEQPSGDEGESEGRGRGKKALAALERRRADALGDQGSKVPRETAADRERRERETRLQPMVSQIAGDSSSGFIESIDRTMKQLAKQDAKRADIGFVLEMAWQRMPAGVSGAVVAKHYKSSAGWSHGDVVAALRGLHAAIRARSTEISELGPMLHGALIVLVHATTSIKAEKQSKVGRVQVVEELVKLHGAVQRPDLPALAGHPEQPHPSGILDAASKLIGSHSELPVVLSMVGQRLFGFDFAFRLPAVAEEVLHAASQSEPPVQPSSVSDQASTKPPSRMEEMEREAEKLRLELEQLTRTLESAEAVRDRLRADLEELRRERASAQGLLSEAIARQQVLSERIMELQDQVESRELVSEQLRVEQGRVRTLEDRVAQLEAGLRQSEAQNQVAKDSEFERGRAAMRTTIAKHCVESLEEIAHAARSIDGDDGEFIRAMSASLASYLDTRKAPNA
jgi:hypothetical protein